MYTSVRLQHYRSYEDISIEFTDGVNIVVGPNASGKTNLLESLYILNTGGSFRVGDEALIGHKFEWARIDGETQHDSRSILLEKNETGLQKTIVLDGVKKKRFLVHHSKPTTLFEPEHLRFLIGSPELRRSYLDDVIAQSDLTIKTHLSQYKRALLQRNRLLKKQPNGWRDQLFVWDLKLSDFGAEIVAARQKLVAVINESIADIYSELSEKPTSLELTYDASVSGDDYRSAALKQFTARLENDMLRGSTSVGPHRDDISVTINGSAAGQSASRGESRTIVLALKIIELQQLEQNTGEKPLLLLDDVFSELDGARRRALTSYLKKYQTIITTTDADAIVKHFLGDANVIATS